jgi:hypothetical protein
MFSKHEKRSSEHETATNHAQQGELFEGVGGRQAYPSPRRRGGGYQHICTLSNFEKTIEQKMRDPRMDELREMGVQQHWLKIAEEVGVDDFLKIWRILDREAQSYDSCGNGRLLVPMRLYSTYLRYQRNRYINTLSCSGMPPSAIQKKLIEQLHEKISIRNISRVAKMRNDAAQGRASNNG